MALNKEKKFASFHLGIKLALLTALISGVANFINKSAVQAAGDPLVFTTLKNTLVAGMVITTLMVSKKLAQLRTLTGGDLAMLIAIGIVGGSLPFYLFFSALAQMPALNAALIHKTLIFWVALLALPLLGERVSVKQLLALLLIFLSNLFVGGFQGFVWSRAELWVLAATVLWAVENIIAKKVLGRVDPDLVIAARMGLGSAVLLMAVAATGRTEVVVELSISEVSSILVSSILLFGYVASWYRALRIAPVTLVATVLTLASLVTNLLSAVLVTGALTLDQIVQAALVITGAGLFVLFERERLKRHSFAWRR